MDNLFAFIEMVVTIIIVVAVPFAPIAYIIIKIANP